MTFSFISIPCFEQSIFAILIKFWSIVFATIYAAGKKK